MAAALGEVFVFKENASVWENISIMKRETGRMYLIQCIL
jgi:hypothetical protein